MVREAQGDSVELDGPLKRRVADCAQASGMTPTDVVRQALEQYLAAHGTNGGGIGQKPRRPLAEIADAISAHIPEEEWAKLPADLAKNFEHYRHGYPRED
jgi:predicted transcriptional regulator